MISKTHSVSCSDIHVADIISCLHAYEMLTYIIVHCTSDGECSSTIWVLSWWSGVESMLSNNDTRYEHKSSTTHKAYRKP